MSVHDSLVLERWRTIFATWRSFGLSVAAFCRSRSLNTSSFYVRGPFSEIVIASSWNARYKRFSLSWELKCSTAAMR